MNTNPEEPAFRDPHPGSPLFRPLSPVEPGQKSGSDRTKTASLARWFEVFARGNRDTGMDLPANSSLRVKGRKFVKFDFSSTDFVNNPEKESRSDAGVRQQLQLNIQGSIWDQLLDINIDYDDSLPRVERQSVEIAYNGPSHDVGFGELQTRARFGDIGLSLPSSHFVSYNKRVFGLRGKAFLRDINILGWQPRQLGLHFVASQEKGRTQKKVFTDQNRRRVPEPLPDVEPIRRRYYQPLADVPDSSRDALLPLRVNSEAVYLDDRNEENNDANTRQKTVRNGSVTVSGDFDRLRPGDDYVIDYRTGVIRFRQTIESDDVIAVDLSFADGSDSTGFLIKDETKSDTFDRYHLLNRYRLASRNIVRDDPDRVIEIQNQNGEVSPDGNRTFAQILGIDRNGDRAVDEQFINFELGVLRFPDTRPFTSASLGARADTNPTVYGPPADRRAVYRIHQEILTRKNTYTLDVNVVRGSESVVVDGKSMRRNVDYTIDYQTGFLTFFDHVDIDHDTRVEVTYESRNGRNPRDETFLGGRVQADLSQNLQFGSTVLSDREEERDAVPQLGRETQSTLVREFDVSWKPLRTLQQHLGETLGFESLSGRPLESYVKLDLKAEWASSARDPSQEGSALIDDFQTLSQRVPLSEDNLDWTPADPVQQFPGSTPVLGGRSSFTVSEVEGTGYDPDPPDEESQKSLRVRLPMGSSTDPDTWASLQRTISKGGRDLRGYQFVELWVKWEKRAEGGTLSLDLGRLSEDTNRDGVRQTEDANGNSVLNPGEDGGYRVQSEFVFGAHNGRLDGEDRDGNGRLDTREQYLHFGAINRSSGVDTATTQDGWIQFKVPLQTSFGRPRGDANRFGDNVTDTPTRGEVLKSVRSLRLTYRAPDGSGTDRSFLLDRSGIVRTAWRNGDRADTFRVDVVSSVEDPRLPPPGSGKFRDDDEDRIEKGMRFIFDNGITAADSDASRARLQLPGGRSFTDYRRLNLFFNTSDLTRDAGSMHLQFGSDDDNFFRYRFGLKDPGSDPAVRSLGGNWFLLEVDLRKFEEDLIRKTLQGIQGDFQSGSRLIRGQPTLRDVREVEIGLVGPLTGRLLFDYLGLDSVRDQQGDAHRVRADINLMGGLLELTGVEREVDGEFRTIGLVNNTEANDFVPQNEERHAVSGSLDLDRYLDPLGDVSVPLQFQWEDHLTRIPPDRIERVLNEDLGRVDRESLSVTGGLKTPSAWPDLSVRWTDSDKNVVQLERDRRFRRERSSLHLWGTHSFPIASSTGDWFPLGETFNLNTRVGFQTDEERRKNFGETPVEERDRTDDHRRLRLRVDWKPRPWIRLQPRYRFRDETSRTPRTARMVKRVQDFDLIVDPAGWGGFDPRVNFGTGTREDVSLQGARPKSIEVDGQTSIRVSTRPRRWWEPLDGITLNYRFKTGGSATYTHLDRGTGAGETRSDFLPGLSWVLEGPEMEVRSDTLNLSRGRANKTLKHGLSGRVQYWGPLTTRYNVNWNRHWGQSDNSIDRTDATTFSLNNRLRLRPLSSWIREGTLDSSLNLAYTLTSRENGAGDQRNHNLNLSWNTRWNRSWNTNLGLSTTLGHSRDRAVEEDLRKVKPSLGFRWLLNPDASGDGPLWFNNRFELNGTVSMRGVDRTRNGVTVEDDSRLSGEIGGAYNLTEAIKTRFSGSIELFRDDFREANDRDTYQLSASTDFRF